MYFLCLFFYIIYFRINGYAKKPTMKNLKQLFSTLSLIIVISLGSTAQNYTTYFTGNQTDVVTTPSGGICMMGGASEHDEAMKWFLQRANGGDILVLRTSGSDGYNNYMYSSLGVSVNSVESIVFNNASASTESYIHQRIQKAEAIWFAGGNQWNYISYWRNTAIDSLINDAISNRHIVIGGTSAGMAILGGYYFSAENGSITSATALSNPYHNRVKVDSTPFISNNYLGDVITDTHYDNPDRRGRHLVFLSRILKDYGVAAKGIACDEYTAVCIDNNGIAMVYGQSPNYDDNAYFIQTNCELNSIIPENCSSGNPLNWNLGGKALAVYAVKGTNSGTNTFDLNDWETGSGGIWKYWYVNNGNFVETAGVQIHCGLSLKNNLQENSSINLFPNPANNIIFLKNNNAADDIISIEIFNGVGQKVKSSSFSMKQESYDINKLKSGIYFIRIKTKSGKIYSKKLIIEK